MSAAQVHTRLFVRLRMTPADQPFSKPTTAVKRSSSSWVRPLGPACPFAPPSPPAAPFAAPGAVAPVAVAAAAAFDVPGMTRPARVGAFSFSRPYVAVPPGATPPAPSRARCSSGGTRASAMTLSRRRIRRVSGSDDSTKCLFCLRTILTLPYEWVHSRINSHSSSGTGTLLIRFRTSMMFSVSRPTETAA